jgi:hypothetical protein
MLKDGRRGAWILVVPASDFISKYKPAAADAEPGLDEDGARFYPAEIIVMVGLAGVLSCMLWFLVRV